jgi:hypothetical protein
MTASSAGSSTYSENSGTHTLYMNTFTTSADTDLCGDIAYLFTYSEQSSIFSENVPTDGGNQISISMDTDSAVAGTVDITVQAYFSNYPPTGDYSDYPAESTFSVTINEVVSCDSFPVQPKFT